MSLLQAEGRRIWWAMAGRQSINFHYFHFQFSGAIWGGVKLAKEQITIWRQRPELTAAIHGRVKKKKKRGWAWVISRIEHIVIRCWQQNEMCEVGQRGWQDKKDSPCPIKSSHTHIHKQNKFSHNAAILYTQCLSICFFFCNIRHKDLLSLVTKLPSAMWHFKLPILKTWICLLSEV